MSGRSGGLAADQPQDLPFRLLPVRSAHREEDDAASLYFLEEGVPQRLQHPEDGDRETEGSQDRLPEARRVPLEEPELVHNDEAPAGNCALDGVHPSSLEPLRAGDEGAPLVELGDDGGAPVHEILQDEPAVPSPREQTLGRKTTDGNAEGAGDPSDDRALPHSPLAGEKKLRERRPLHPAMPDTRSQAAAAQQAATTSDAHT